MLGRVKIVTVTVSEGYCCAAVTVFSSGKLLEVPEKTKGRKKHQQDLEKKSFKGNRIRMNIVFLAWKE